MVRRFETGHASARCGFSGDGEHVLSCAGDDCGLMVLSAGTGAVKVSLRPVGGQQRFSPG
jgi:hypothetical protein